MSDVVMKPVGHVVGGRAEAVDDDWMRETACIQLDEREFTGDALQGLGDFSHAEIIFHFNKVPQDKITKDARHPRGNTDWPKVGIFAQRGKNRPNLMAVSVCEVIRVDGTKLYVRGLDAINGTPVLDIKPVMTGFQPQSDIREPDWAKEIMVEYWEKT